MASINNVQVYGLAEAIYRSGYPMMDHAPTPDEFRTEVDAIAATIKAGETSQHLRRAFKLATSKGGGHDQFLTGIHVDFDLGLSNKAWVEAERYTFLNFISSMSTMHRVAVLPLRESCNEYVSGIVLGEVDRLKKEYHEIDGEAHPQEKKDAYLRLLYNLPSGFELVAGMTTNYRCLKNIYAQRRTHRLPDWHVVCDWIETLPFPELIVGAKNG